MIDTSCQVGDVRLMVKPETDVWLQLSGSGMQWTWWTNTSFGGTPQLSSVTYRASSPNSSRLTLGSKTRPLIYILAPITVHDAQHFMSSLFSNNAWIFHFYDTRNPSNHAEICRKDKRMECNRNCVLFSCTFVLFRSRSCMIREITSVSKRFQIQFRSRFFDKFFLWFFVFSSFRLYFVFWFKKNWCISFALFVL